MAIVDSKFPANLFVPTIKTLTRDLTGGSDRLRLEQQVQALVVAAENDRSVLEIGSQRYQVSGKTDLQPGEKLTLQVKQLEPQLEFRVLSSRVDSRMAQSFPLLAQPFDWGELVVQLQSLAAKGQLSQSTLAVLNQLADILTFSVAPSDLKEQVTQIIVRLQQLTAPEVEELFSNQGGVIPFSPPVSQSYPVTNKSDLSQAISSLLKNLQNQPSLLLKSGSVSETKDVAVELKGLLHSLAAGRDIAQVKGVLQPILDQLQQTSSLPPRLVIEVQRILTQLDSQNFQMISNIEEKGVLPPSVVGGSPLDSSAAGPELMRISTEIGELFSQITQLQDKGAAVPPDLLGRLEGLQLRLLAIEGTSFATPEMENLLSQLTQLVSQRPATLSGHQLGVLSQLFGFHLETELFEGKKKAAMASLKLCLLELQKTGDGDDVDGPLRRLELLQLCKAKLAADQVQFLPLPFSELEEGYLLAEKKPESDEVRHDKAPLQMSLSLRLSALGNVRIDMLYDDEGLHLRLAGEDQRKMKFMQSCSEELKDSLSTVKLQGVSFSADARLPTRQLQERLLPNSQNMLDTRI